MTIDQFMATIESKAPPAPREKVEELEAALGQHLPDDYRRFLLACNGGYLSASLPFSAFTGGVPSVLRAGAAFCTIGAMMEQDQPPL